MTKRPTENKANEPMTVEQLDDLIVKFLEAKDASEKAQGAADDAKELMKFCQSAVIGALEGLDKTENEGFFGKVKVVQREYYKVLDKHTCYEWLKARGEFDDLASVNANTLSSHVKAIIHQRREQENDYIWLPPGMQDSTSDYKYLRVTKPKS